MIDTHPAAEKLKATAKAQDTNHFALLGQIIDNLVKETKAPFVSYLIRNMNLYPDLHGNRSPLARPDMRGMLNGIALDKTTNDLALRYLVTCEAIALQTRQIVDEMNSRGHEIQSIFMSGGLVKNPILMQMLADICNMPVQLPFSHSASVVLGSAMLGCAAAHTEETKQGPITTQDEALQRSTAMKDRLWGVMVRARFEGSAKRCTYLSTGANVSTWHDGSTQSFSPRATFTQPQIQILSGTNRSPDSMA